MAGVIEDKSGQWIVLSGFAISLFLIILAVLINQATITGYYSSYAALEFPKDQIRDLTEQTRDSAKSSAQLAWKLNHTSNQSVFQNFTALMDNYSKQVSTIYNAHGISVNITLFNFNYTDDVYTYIPDNITFFNSTHRIDSIWLNISYNDGTTCYASEPEIIGVEQ